MHLRLAVRLTQIAFSLAMPLIAGVSLSYGAENAQSFSYQGRLLNSSGTAALTGTAEIKFEILNNNKDCVLYSEKQSVDLGTSGAFALQVGSPTGDAKRAAAGNDPGLTLAKVFANSGSVTGKRTSDGTACSYSPAAGDSRFLRVTVTPQAGSPFTLDPDQTINSVPQATVAETVQGKIPAEFVQITGNGGTAYSLSKTNLDKIFAAGDAQGLHHHDNEYVKLGSTPSFSSVTISGTPTNGTDACTKGYADTKFGGSALDLASLANGQSIRWDSAQSKWIVYTPSTVTQVSGTGPITVSNGTTTPTIGINDATSLASGAMSAAHYLMVDNATEQATADRLVKRDASGNFSAGTITATFSGNGAAVTDLNASNLATGTVPVARLGSGTADSTTYLRGDGTWATPGGSSTASVVSKSANYSVTADDAIILGNASAGSFTLTLPSAVGITGKQYTIKKTDSSSNEIYLATTGGQTIDGITTGAMENQYQFTSVISDGTNWSIINGTLASARLTAADCAASGGTWGTSAVATGACDWVYDNVGSFNWTAPSRVQSVSVVCIGGGGGGNDPNGGGGGALAYSNNISVVPGNSYSVIVGTGGAAGSTTFANAGDGGTSSFSSVVSAGGGKGARYDGYSVTGGTVTAGTGYRGGHGALTTALGGGGAGGYTAAGGDAVGGGTSGGGGGTGLYGGSGSAGGSNGSTPGTAGPGGGTVGGSISGSQGGNGGNFGGGGGRGNGGFAGGAGARGACRIVWPGDQRSFPSTNVGTP